MPLVDMPLEQLLTYEGRNPRPANFEAYWEQALQEMRNTDARVELVRSEFQVPFAECFHLYFTGTGGARIHAKLVKPKHVAGRHPAVVQFHGYAHHSDDWADKLIYASLGFTIATLDCRGQGGLSEDVGGVKGTTHKGHLIRGLDDAPERLLFRQIYLDAAQLAGIVMDMPEVDTARVGAIGGSQGGGWRWPVRRLSRGSTGLHPVFRSCVIINGYGKWTWPEMPTRNCGRFSVTAIPSTCGRMRFLNGSAILMFNTWRTGSAAR